MSVRQCALSVLGCRLLFVLLMKAMLVVAVVATLMLTGNGVSQASHDTTHGDLLLEDGRTPTPTGFPLPPSSNTPTSLGTIERQLCNVTVNSTVTIDVVAVDAEDWLGMSFLVYFPSPSVVTSPGPGDTGDNGPFDFIPADVVDEILVFNGPQNFLLPGDPDVDPDGAGPLPDAQGLYDGTEAVSDGSSPHGISVFDGSIENGNSGNGALARITLDTTGLVAGEYTLLLSKDTGNPGGLHSATPPTPPSPFLPDNFGAFMLAIGQACSTDTDGDGVSDADEATFGSCADDGPPTCATQGFLSGTAAEDSIPESADWIPVYNAPTCSDGIDNDRDGFTDGTDKDCPPPAPAPSDKTMDLDAGSLPDPLDQDDPVGTDWHELSPNFSEPWHLDAFFDNAQPVKSATDFPNADKANTGSWTNEVPTSCGTTATTCSDSIDEDIVTPDDADYIESPTNASAATVDFELTDAPVDLDTLTDLEVSFRASKDGVNAATVEVEVHKSDTTLLGSPTTETLTATETDFSYTITGLSLTPSEVDGLFVRVIGDAGTDTTVRVQTINVDKTYLQGILSPGDTIEMFHMGDDGAVGGVDGDADGPNIFYLVDDLTITIFLIEVDGGGNDIADTETARELVGAGADSAAMQAAIDDPEGTFWHEVDPNFSEIWHLSDWDDVGASLDLDAGDKINMTNVDTEVNKNYRVDDISLDILLTVIPDPAAIPECGAGVDVGGGIVNEVPGAPPPASDGSELLCHYNTTISSAGADGDADTCVVGLPCTFTTVFSIDRPPSTVQVPQPAERAPLAPSVIVLTGASFDFASDADVADGDIVGQIAVNIGSDLGTPPCNSDLVLGPNFLLDGTIDPGTSTGSVNDLFDPDTWPLQLTMERAAIEAQFSGDLTLIARSVTSFDIIGSSDPDVPLNILYWAFDPLAGELVPGEGAGGWVTASFTGDPEPEGGSVVPFPSPAGFCTPFISTTTTFGTTSGTAGNPGPAQYRTCLTAGSPRDSSADMEPNALNGTDVDVGTRFDVGACVPNGEHDVRVIRLGRRGPSIRMTPSVNAIRPVTVVVQNQSPHQDTFVVQVTGVNPAPGDCDINGDDSASVVVFTTTVENLDPGQRVTFKGGTLDIVFHCDPVPDGGEFVLIAAVDHNGDDVPLPDNDDIDPADNAISKAITVKAF